MVHNMIICKAENINKVEYLKHIWRNAITGPDLIIPDCFSITGHSKLTILKSASQIASYTGHSSNPFLAFPNAFSKLSSGIRSPPITISIVFVFKSFILSSINFIIFLHCLKNEEKQPTIEHESYYAKTNH